MKYQNRQPAEGINVTQHNALLYFLKLFVALIVFIVVVVVTLTYLGAAIAKKVPFRYELSLMDRLEVSFGENRPEEMVTYLSTLSTRLAEHLPVPEGMEFTLHYNADEVFNAFATVGGNLVFHRELLRQMPHENALAMVMAHEMSHIIHRDPLAGLGGGVTSTVAVMMITGTSVFGSNILNETGALTQLTFSRGMELAADRAALQAVAGLYGHVAGADTLFRLLAGSGSTEAKTENRVGVKNLKVWLAEFGSTHPLDQRRIDSIGQMAQDNNWLVKGRLTDLPADYHRWLNADPG